MPLYEFKCPKCGKIVERLQKYSDPAPVCCTAMTRLTSLSSFHLKGSGWYSTDYKKNKESKQNEPSK
jgi:putative FmdB family regulatory protein